jgi:hypothetical protein
VLLKDRVDSATKDALPLSVDEQDLVQSEGIGLDQILAHDGRDILGSKVVKVEPVPYRNLDWLGRIACRLTHGDILNDALTMFVDSGASPSAAVRDPCIAFRHKVSKSLGSERRLNR